MWRGAFLARPPAFQSPEKVRPELNEKRQLELLQQWSYIHKIKNVKAQSYSELLQELKLYSLERRINIGTKLFMLGRLWKVLFLKLV